MSNYSDTSEHFLQNHHINGEYGDDSDNSDGSDDDDHQIMAIDSDYSDGSSDGIDRNRFVINTKKGEMASDLESDDNDEDDHNGNDWAVGSIKSQFYNTDYKDKDFRNINETEQQLAQYEEEEALSIQKRLLQSINESDIGINFWTEKPDKIGYEDNTRKENILILNLSKLSEREKLKLLAKEAPECEPLINDFVGYMTEIRDSLLPIINVLNSNNVETSVTLNYINIRYQIIMNYCINISFYMHLKSKRLSVKDHAVIKQLLLYKKLILELNNISSLSNINHQIDNILEKVKNGHTIQVNVNNSITKIEAAVQLSDDISRENIECVEHVSENLKRGITYQMEKNKGLTQKRKKELRNPRVKHRMKFRKAKIRRKGQVREPRNELQRYGGEVSGIRSTVIKSVKFK